MDIGIVYVTMLGRCLDDDCAKPEDSSPDILTIGDIVDFIERTFHCDAGHDTSFFYDTKIGDYPSGTGSLQNPVKQKAAGRQIPKNCP